MARLRVPAQALRNFLSILLGFALGGINNLFVLPWAFEDDLGSWGLVRIAAAWAMIFGPLLAFGAPSAFNRFKGTFTTEGKLPELYTTLLAPPLVLFLGLVALPALVIPESVADVLGLEGENRKAVWPIALLSGITGLQIYFSGFLSSRLKTSLATFARETFVKFGYLALAVALGLGWLGQAAFLPAFVGLYLVVLTLLIAQSLANRFTITPKRIQNRTLTREIRKYSGTLIIGSSAWMILGQIDIIMIGRCMGLEHVPAYTIAAFIAAVAQVPYRSFTRLLQPLIASALHAKDERETWRLMGMTHRSMLLISGWILACIWVCIPELDQLLPAAFKGLGTVIAVVGLIKVLQSASMGSSMLLGQSDHYQKTVWINWMMVILAIPLNLWFIPDSGLGLGLVGAALATLIAVGLAVTLRQIIVWKVWRVFVPDLGTLRILLVIVAPAILINLWHPAGIAMGFILLKSSLVTAWLTFATMRLNLAPEVVNIATERLNKMRGIK